MGNLQRKLKEGKVALGTHISLNDSQITELIGNVGFDYIWIDTEHSSISLERVLQHLIAARATDTSAIVRVPSNDPIRVKPILEMGPDGIVFPQVNSYEEAVQAVRSCMYPPKGIRGFGPRRAIQFGLTDLGTYFETIDDELLKLIQIENIHAVEDLEKMLTIEDISAFILGPCDLAASMGKLGAVDDPEVQQTIDYVFKTVHQHHKKIGVSFGACSMEVCATWKQRGADMISIAADTDYLLEGSRNVLRTLSTVFEGKARC